jgi:hypothetical protein
VTIFLAASFALGLENVNAILKSYDFETFNAELNTQGLTAIRKSYESTVTFGTLAAKAELMENIVHSNKWAFKGVSLEEFLANPLKLYHETQRYMWSLNAEDGHYMGERGMAQEFNANDEAGSRQSAGYVALGIDPSLLNRILLHYYGVWSTPENQEIAAEIDRWHKVGVSDYYAKVINGYYTQSWMGTKMDYLTEYKYFVETMITLGLLNPAVYNDTFNYDETKLITDQWVLSSGNWTVVKDSIIPFNTKSPLTRAPGATPVDPNEKVLSESGVSSTPAVALTKKSFKDISHMVWIKPSVTGEVGLISRASDSDNYYLLSYGDGKLSIKKNVNGTMTLLEEKSKTLSADQAYRFHASFTGAEIKFYVNGTLELSVTDNSFTEGHIGLYNRGGSSKFDAVLIQNTNPDIPTLDSLTVGNEELTVHIGTVEGAIQYKIKYGTQPGVYTSSVVTNKKSTVLKNLTNNTTYYVVVSAETAIGESLNSRELSMTPMVPDAVTPVLNNVIADGSDLIINFTTDPKNTSYIIRYGTVTGNYVKVVEGISTSGYKLPVKSSHVPYYIVVAGQNASGLSANSNEKVGKANSEVLFRDEFTTGVATADWIYSIGKFNYVQTDGNFKMKSYGNNPDRAWIADGMVWKDYAVSAKVSISPDTASNVNEAYLMGRTTNANNYYLVGLSVDKTTSKTFISIRKKANGGFTTLKDEEIVWNGAEEFEMKAEFNGSSIKMYLNDELISEVEDNGLAVGTAGILTANAAVTYDDFHVELLNGLQQPVIQEVVRNGTEAVLKLNAVENAESYRIKYGEASGMYTNEIIVDNLPAEGITVEGLDAAKAYFITVSAFGMGMESENAAEATIASSTGNPGNPGNGGGVGGNNPPPTTTAPPVIVNEEAWEQSVNGQVKIVLPNQQGKIVLPDGELKAEENKSVVVEAGEATIQLSAEWLSAVLNSIPENQRTESDIVLNIQKSKKTKLVSPMSAVKLKQVTDQYEIEASISKDGTETKISEFQKPVTLSFPAPNNNNKKLLGIYLIGEDGTLTYVGNPLHEDVLTAEVTQAGNYAVLEYKREYGDVPMNHWASSAIESLSAKHIIQGMNETEFAPQKQVTRAEFAAMLVRTLGLQSGTVLPFGDISQDDWYADAIAKAFAAGLVSGVSENEFRPNEIITREQMAAMLVRAYESLRNDVPSSDSLGFDDAGDVSDWAKDELAKAVALQLVQGRTEETYIPQGISSRAESAQAILNLLTALN